MAYTPIKAKSTGASGKYKTFKRGESGTKSGTGGGKAKEKSSYAQVESARTGGGSSGGYTLPGGAKVEPKAETSYPAVAAEREKLVKEAAAAGTATTKQEREASRVNISQDKNFQAYSRATEEYNTSLKRQGIQNAGEYFAAVRGERSPRETSYQEVREELKRRRQALQNAPEPPLFLKEKVYTAQELGARERAVIKVAEFVVQKEAERAERYAAFEERIAPLNIFQRGAAKVGYAVGVGFGETLASTAAKAFVFTGALMSDSLRPLATTEAKRAAGETVEVLKEEYNPRTVKGITNIGLTALAIYGLGRYRAAQRANAKSAVLGEPVVSDKVKSKFNLADKDVSPASGKVVSTASETARYTKTGEQVTALKGGKSSVSGDVLTERGTVTIPKRGKTASVLYPERPGAKVTISYAGVGGEGITTTTRRGILYNYERVSYVKTPPRTVGQRYLNPPKPEVISEYYKINRLTGKRSYLGASKSPNTAELKLLEPQSPQTETFKRDGVAPRRVERTTQLTEGLGKKRAGLKLEIKSETITSTEAASVPSAKPGALKAPAQQPGATVTKTPEGMDVTPFKTKIKLSKTPSKAAQPKQEVTLDLEKPSVSTKTPALIETKTRQATQSRVRLSFNNRNIVKVTDTPNFRVTRFATAEEERRLLTVRVKPNAPSTPRRLLTLKVQPETVLRTVNVPQVQQPAPVPVPELALPPDVKNAAGGVVFAPPIARARTQLAPPRLEAQPTPQPKPILQGDIKTDYRREIAAPPTRRQLAEAQPKPVLIGEIGLKKKLEARAVQSQTPKPIQQPEQIPALITEPIQRGETIPQQIIRLQPKKPREPSPPVFGGGFFDTPEPETKSGGLFTTLVRRRGKFQAIGTSPTEKAAQRLGELSVKETAAASFKVTSGGEALELAPSFGFTRSKRERGVILQPRERRIKTAGEKSEITFKGIRETKARKGRKRAFNLFGGL